MTTIWLFDHPAGFQELLPCKRWVTGSVMTIDTVVLDARCRENGAHINCENIHKSLLQSTTDNQRG